MRSGSEALWAVLLLASCQPSAEGARPPNATNAPVPTHSAPSAPSSRTPTAASSSPPADELCNLTVTKLDPPHDESAPTTLSDVLASTPVVAVVVPVLDATDCSGVGWHHLAFEPFDAAHAEGLVRAYRSMPLPAQAPARAPFYLMGASVDGMHEVDLKAVCVAFKARVSATAVWLVPLPDRADAQAWNERLSRGVCGRARPGCRGCENNCGNAPGCCHTVEDSCPGERGRYSTCIGFVPCDAFCCE